MQPLPRTRLCTCNQVPGSVRVQSAARLPREHVRSPLLTDCSKARDDSDAMSTCKQTKKHVKKKHQKAISTQEAVLFVQNVLGTTDVAAARTPGGNWGQLDNLHHQPASQLQGSKQQLHRTWSTCFAMGIFTAPCTSLHGL